jgi:hypothetical protein
VQQREDDVDLAQLDRDAAGRERDQRRPAGGQRERRARLVHRRLDREPLVARGQDPPAVLGDAHGHHVVLRLVDHLQHTAGAEE